LTPPGNRAARRDHGPPRHPLLIPLAAAYAAVVFAWLYLRHQHFGSAAFELGAYHSILWNVAIRHTPWNSLERSHQWSTHLEPVLLFLAPFYRVVASPVWLWLLECLGCAAAVLPIDAIARRVTGDAVVGLLAGLAMLVGPQLVLGQLADYHTLALCALPLAVIVWAIEVDSSRGLVLASAAAIGLREQMGAVVALAAVLWVVRHGWRRGPPAAILAIVALGIFATELFLIIPSFGTGQSAHLAAHYAGLGGSADEALRTAASRPLGVASTVLEMGRARYVIALMSGALPLAFLALRSLRKAAWPLVLALPPLAVQLVASASRKYDIHAPYGVPLVPLIAAAAVLALCFIPTDRYRDARRLAAGGWLLLSLAHLAQLLPSPVGVGCPIDPGFEGSARQAAIQKAIAQVPQDLSISAQDNIVPHVATRSEVHLWPDGEATDDYVLLDSEGVASNVRNPASLTASARRLRANPRFELLVDEAGVVLAKRRQR
jgi:uncharacterized membrane protein